MNELYYCLLLFTSGVVTDVLWALYIKYISEGKLLIGAFFSTSTGVCTIIFVEGLLNSKLSMIFWLAGLFIGTWQAKKIETLFINLWKKL
jgi:hypothetical protein